MPAWDRLSALDASFLSLEDGAAHMHIGGLLVFDGGPLREKSGALDIATIRRAVHAKLHRVPRYRQRLAFVPYENHPVWIDDDRFNLDYHVRLTALPRPGGPEQLKRLTARIMSQMLDRGKPLWELWCVEGMPDNRFAIITKAHHCMVDGVSGSDIISTLLDTDPKAAISRPQPWTPQEAPGTVGLMADALRHRLEQPVELLKATRRAIRHPAKAVLEAEQYMTSIAEAIAPGLRRASRTPLNVPIGPHRRFTWLEIPLADIKAIKDALGGTVNDVVLATVAGGIRRYLHDRGQDVDALDFRAMVPVSVRAEEERGLGGNRVSALVAPLPVHLRSAKERLYAVTQATENLKSSHAAVGAKHLTAVGEFTGANLLVQAARLFVRSRAFNLVVTNVPGPQRPLYLHGARLLATYPVVPLTHYLALGIALYSYDGRLFWGLNADWEAVPTVDAMADALRAGFTELQAATRSRGAARTRKSTKSATAGKTGASRKRARSRA